jgi:deazaflavin-dependent oxidoreductase (nitroreductase family)
VELQVEDRAFPAHARTVSGEERELLWRKANEIWPHYDEYAQRTDREIPVVVLERT